MKQRKPVVDANKNKKSTTRKKYEKPAITYSAPLEAMAANCRTGGTPDPGKASLGAGCTNIFS